MSVQQSQSAIPHNCYLRNKGQFFFYLEQQGRNGWNNHHLETITKGSKTYFCYFVELMGRISFSTWSPGGNQLFWDENTKCSFGLSSKSFTKCLAKKRQVEKIETVYLKLQISTVLIIEDLIG